jgi:type VI secretion system protein ImpM
MDQPPLTGFHGKLPGAGDFVARGLPVGFATFWDGWATRHIARREGWPEGGLRLRLQSGGRVAAGVVIASHDRVGRRFPLAAFVVAGALPGPEGLDGWCDAALAALCAAQGAGLSPDELDASLDALRSPDGAEDGAALQLWTLTAAPEACDPAQPQDLLDRLFSCSGSSIP